MTQIANEYGFTQGSATRLGDYRTTNGQGNFPVSFGTLSFSSIDGGGSIPVGSNPISMSDFRGTQLQQVVNFYGAGKGGNRLNAKNRYNNNSSGDVAVVGNYRTRPSNSSGTKVHIHVNQTIGSEKSNVQHCALRTGSWNSSTTPSFKLNIVSPSLTAILKPNTPMLNLLLLITDISTAPKVPSPFKKSEELPGKLNLFNAIAADGEMSLLVIDAFDISADETELG